MAFQETTAEQPGSLFSDGSLRRGCVTRLFARALRRNIPAVARCGKRFAALPSGLDDAQAFRRAKYRGKAVLRVVPNLLIAQNITDFLPKGLAMKPFLRRTAYTGPVQAVILDWAGTAVDHGCRGPVAVFSRAFERYGIAPEVAEVRAPMGREKREHVQSMLAMPRLAELWRVAQDSAPDDAATDKIFAAVQELMPETLADYATPVPGCVEAIAALRAKGLKIGSCTGYSRNMTVRLMPRAEALGYKPDARCHGGRGSPGSPLAVDVLSQLPAPRRASAGIRDQGGRHHCGH